jgi:hypothetical protein
MQKNIQLVFLLVFILNIATYAQDSTSTKVATTAPIADGYYQRIDLNPNSPCNCNQKTQRTTELAKGLRPNDVLDYKIYAYSFTFGNNTNAVSKLFKSFENDLTIYKVSMKEWSAFMLLTTKDFDFASFEKAAQSVFATFAPMTPEDFLKIKNTTSYNEYIQAKQEFEMKQQQHIVPLKN